MRKCPPLENHNGLLVYGDKESKKTLGYLWHTESHGTYDATYGRVDVSKEDSDKHNKILDECILKGLDSCPVGKGGIFYFSKPNRVRTWLGVLVATATVHGNVVTFMNKGMVFRGRLRKYDELFFFKRIK